MQARAHLAGHPDQSSPEVPSAGTVARAMWAVDHLIWWLEYQTDPSQCRHSRPMARPVSSNRQGGKRSGRR